MSRTAGGRRGKQKTERSKQFDDALPGLADSDPLHWNEKTQGPKFDWQVLAKRTKTLAAVSIPIKLKYLFTNLALAGSPRWTEYNFEPAPEAPRNSEPSPCCSTSRATFRIPLSLVSKRPCLLQKKHRSEKNRSWEIQRTGPQKPTEQKEMITCCFWAALVPF